jgi:hypothetical protein
MKNFCEKHHLGYIGARCPMCEKERIASFRVSKASKVVPGLASRESYYDEYVKPEPMTISDSDMEAMLLEKFGKVSKL